MKRPPIEAECDRILIVEGYSDLLFCAAFLTHLDRLNGVFIKSFEGKGNILKKRTLETYLSPAFLNSKKSIGILVDADENPSGVTTALHDHLYEISGQDIKEGEWCAGQPKLGFFVAPNGVGTGELETLVWNSWSAKVENAAGRDSVLEHLTRMANAGWTAKSPDKARIAAFLAAAYDEDPRLGPGAREGLFIFDDPGFERLQKFLLEFTDPIAS